MLSLGFRFTDNVGKRCSINRMLFLRRLPALCPEDGESQTISEKIRGVELQSKEK